MLKLSLLEKIPQSRRDENTQRDIQKCKTQIDKSNPGRQSSIEKTLGQLDAELKKINTNFTKQMEELESEIKQIQATINPHASLQKLDKNLADQTLEDANLLMSEYEFRKTLLEEAKLHHGLAAFQERLQAIKFTGNNQDTNKKQQIESIIFNIETMTLNLLTVQERLEAIKKNLNGSKLIDSIEDIRQDYRQRYDDSEREINYYLSTHRTKGCHSEAPIILPTKETNHRFYLEEELVLLAIAREREENYSFITNNCVSSVKRCLIAGLTDEVKKALKERAKFTDDDFEVAKAETPVVFQAWLFKLDMSLRYLNSLPKDNKPEPESVSLRSQPF